MAACKQCFTNLKIKVLKFGGLGDGTVGRVVGCVRWGGCVGGWGWVCGWVGVGVWVGGGGCVGGWGWVCGWAEWVGGGERVGGCVGGWVEQIRPKTFRFVFVIEKFRGSAQD